jgi:uncharacterized protein YfiM (DUF2279 family)
MKLFVALLLSLSLVSAADDWNTAEWWTQDKQEHFNYSFLISSTIYGIVKNQKKKSTLDAFIYSIGVTLLIGWLKEQEDGFSDGVKEVGDIDADALGAISGAVSMYFVYKIEF